MSNYVYRSERCRHGFCKTTIGCEKCGIKVKRGAGHKLRRATDRRTATPRHAEGYALNERRGRGNRNAVGGGEW